MLGGGDGNADYDKPNCITDESHNYPESGKGTKRVDLNHTGKRLTGYNNTKG